MTRAIWYRHWLEIRLPVTIGGIAVALLCLFPVAVALFTALLAAGTGTLLATGGGVPLGAMAATSVVAGMLAVALQAVFGVLLSLWNEWLSVAAYYAGFLAFLMAVPTDS